jgi:hypothetical protein
MAVLSFSSPFNGAPGIVSGYRLRVRFFFENSNMKISSSEIKERAKGLYMAFWHNYVRLDSLQWFSRHYHI